MKLEQLEIFESTKFGDKMDIIYIDGDGDTWVLASALHPGDAKRILDEFDELLGAIPHNKKPPGEYKARKAVR